MAGARDDISALIDRYPDARFAVIAFAVTSVAGLAAVGGHLESAAGDVGHDAVRVDARRRYRRPTSAQRATCCATS